METDKYKILLKVMECRSFSKAASELGYTQSAISHSIYSLENSFGFRLLVRDSGKIALTFAGKKLLPYIMDVVHSQDALDQYVSAYLGIETGELCIASIPSLGVHRFPAMLQEFNDQHPNVKIQVIHGNYSDVERLLAESAVEIGFLSVSAHTPFPYTVLFRERLSVILPPGHPLAKKKKLRLKDLESEPFIMPGEGPRHQVGDLIKTYDLKLNIKYSITDDDITIAMVARGLGITILPEMSYQDYLNFDFEVRELEESPYRDIGIAYTSWDNVSPIGKTFIEMAKGFFSEQKKIDKQDGE